MSKFAKGAACAAPATLQEGGHYPTGGLEGAAKKNKKKEKKTSMNIKVILPLALANNYTYSVPSEMEAGIAFGIRVIVEFGARAKKQYTAIVVEADAEAPEGVELKPIASILDQRPVITPTQYKLWQWIARYYQCTPGEVMKAALPSSLKLESETLVTLVPDAELSEPLKPKEQQIVDALSDKCKAGATAAEGAGGQEEAEAEAEEKQGKGKGGMTISELNKAIDAKDALRVVKGLMDKGVVRAGEQVRQKYRDKTEMVVTLAPEHATNEELQQLLDQLQKATQQQKLLVAYLQMSHYFAVQGPAQVTRKELLEKSGCTPATLKQLVDKGILAQDLRSVSRLKDYAATTAANALSQVQEEAMRQTKELFGSKQVVLLHGVTGSGKTEIYIHLIEETLAQGRQALFLLPEIALTTQITNRLRRVFGSRLTVYHSKVSDAERAEIWNNMLEGSRSDVVLGVRSSVLLPFRDLGLVIVDEEHETCYKQFDPAPRYHARDTAIVLSGLFGGRTLLGSATPSVETYFSATHNKFGLVSLTQRHEGVLMPQIDLVDLRDARKRKEMRGHFSQRLIDEVGKALQDKAQVILFQNRRGFAPYMQCDSCGFVPKCQNCDVSLTYHKRLQMLTCHYCGYAYPMPVVCPACGNPAFGTRGFGTEKIEEEVREIFPEASVARLDLDTTRSRTNFEKIIADFEAGRTNILVGTQMISKGLDFERVRVVGVLNADSLLSVPDFRAGERAYQMMAQVAGRAGRRGQRGRVIVQTSKPEDPILNMVRDNDYGAMFAKEMEERHNFNYPPYFRLVNVYTKGKQEDVVQRAAVALATALRGIFNNRVIGPDRPPVGRIQNFYIRKTTVKLERGLDLDKAKELMREAQNQVRACLDFKQVIFYDDIDPA